MLTPASRSQSPVVAVACTTAPLRHGFFVRWARRAVGSVAPFDFAITYCGSIGHDGRRFRKFPAMDRAPRHDRMCIGGMCLFAGLGTRTEAGSRQRFRGSVGQSRSANLPSGSRLARATTRAGLWLWAGKSQDRGPRSMVAPEARIRAQMLQGSGKGRSRAPTPAAGRRQMRSIADALDADRSVGDATIRSRPLRHHSHFFAPLGQHSQPAVKFG